MGPRQIISKPGVVCGVLYGFLLDQGWWELKKVFSLLRWICLSYSELTQRQLWRTPVEFTSCFGEMEGNPKAKTQQPFPSPE